MGEGERREGDGLDHFREDGQEPSDEVRRYAFESRFEMEAFGPYHTNMMDERRAGRHLGIPKSLTSSSYIALKIDTDIYILTLSRSLVKLLLSLTLVPTLTDGAESWKSSGENGVSQRYSL